MESASHCQNRRRWRRWREKETGAAEDGRAEADRSGMNRAEGEGRRSNENGWKSNRIRSICKG